MSHVPIRVSTIRGDQKIDFDAYVKIAEKYVLYLRRGESFEGTRLDRLKAKKLRKMYILENDESTYRNYLTQNIEMAYDQKSGKDLNLRAEIIQGDQQAKTEAVMENPDDASAYHEAKNAAQKFSQLLMQESDVFKYVLNMENADQSITHHGVTVSTMAVSLAKKLGITDETKLQMLALGSLLHDFEHFHSGLSIGRNIDTLSENERILYKKHPLEGAARVQGKKHFDPQVITIIAQHEEYIDGKGFPNGLNEGRTDPLAVIVATCNSLDRMITFEGVPRSQAVKKFIIEHVGRHPLQQMQLLGQIMEELKT